MTNEENTYEKEKEGQVRDRKDVKIGRKGKRKKYAVHKVASRQTNSVIIMQ